MSRNGSAAPNVVVFFTDQQRWDTTGVHGNPLDLTPNFDRVARQGTHVYNSFTCQPLCGPARAYLQAGTYATTTGCFRNAIPLPSGFKTCLTVFETPAIKRATSMITLRRTVAESGTRGDGSHRT